MVIKRGSYKKPAKKKRKGWGRKHSTVEYRSGLEKVNQDDLKAKGVPYDYEKHKVPYTIPAAVHHYTPDFTLRNGIVIETKGRFLAKDRKKHLLVRDQNPDIEIRFVFSNSKDKIYTRSRTTNAMWADKYGFKWADKRIPDEWIDEQPNQIWIAAIEKLRK